MHQEIVHNVIIKLVTGIQTNDVSSEDLTLDSRNGFYHKWNLKTVYVISRTEK